MAKRLKFSLRKMFSAEASALTNAIHRCHNTAHPAYRNYGERGISVSPLFKGPAGFYHFLTVVGPRPGPQYSLDRVDNDGNYEPGNIRWAPDRLTQQQNRRKTRRPVEDLGWGVGYTVRTKSVKGSGGRPSALVPYKGTMWTIKDASRDAGIRTTTIAQRIRRGVKPEDAFDAPVRKRASRMANPTSPTIH
jgi:hypothetical protein